MHRVFAFLVIAMLLATPAALTAQDVPKPSAEAPQNYSTKEEAIAAGKKSLADGFELYKKQTGDAYRQAIAKFQQAAAAFDFGGDKRSEGDALTLAGKMYFDLREKQNALDCFKRALALEREVGNRVVETAILNNIGATYADLGENEKALDFYGQALAPERATGNRRGEAATLANMGTVYAFLGDKHKALDFFNQALPLLHALGEGKGEATTLSNIGKTYDDLGEKQKALDFFNQALALQRTLNDHAGEAITLSNIGSVYNTLGQKQKALDFYNQALPLKHELGDSEGEAVTLNNIGALYDDLGEKQKALDFYNQALPLRRKADDRRGEAATLSNIGLIYSNLGEKQKALDSYNQALTLQRAVGDHSGEAITLSNIGVVYHDLGEHQKALDFYNQALPLQRAAGDRAGEATTLSNIGRAYDNLGKKEKALDLYSQALSLSRAVGVREHEAVALSNLMFLLGDRNPALAIVFGKQSVNVLQSLRRDISGLSQDVQKTFAHSQEDTYRKLADLLISGGRLYEAQQVLDLLKDQEYFEFVRRGEAVAGSAPVTLIPKDAQPLVEIEREKEALAAKESLTAVEQERKDYLDAQLKAAKIAAQEFFDDKGRVIAGADQKSIQTASANEQSEAIGLQKDLPPDTVAIYTLVDENSFHALLITPTLMKTREYKIGRTELRKTVFNFHETLVDQNKNAMPQARQLYDIIVGDLGKELVAVKATTILWSLDDVLRYVPMAALHDGRHYMAERFRNVVYNKNSSRTGGKFSGWRALAAGVSQEHGDLQALTSVPGELRSVVRSESDPKSRGVLPGRILLDPEFSAGAFRAALHQDYPVVHIASHFVFKPGNETDSYLLLGDGKLTLAKLRESDDYTFRRVQLLTLSACETAVGSSGDGKEVDGLAFLAEEKGARAVMATLWEVDDESTGEFMRRFYRELTRMPGTTKAEALQRAQLALLQGKIKRQESPKEDFTHPYFWAPFILLGNGN